MIMSDILKELKEYFKNTPKEEIEKAWEETKKYDSVGMTVKELKEWQKKCNNNKTKTP